MLNLPGGGDFTFVSVVGKIEPEVSGFTFFFFGSRSR